MNAEDFGFDDTDGNGNGGDLKCFQDVRYLLL